jgi:hypothetical protein
MPIQYYDPDWYNNRPPQARAKFEAKLVVVFPPNSKDFFSRRGDNTLSVEELTAKYGEDVFANYDLDFGKADAEASGEGNDLDDADDEGEGDIIGSEDSDEEAESSDIGSVTSFIDEIWSRMGMRPPRRNLLQRMMFLWATLSNRSSATPTPTPMSRFNFF